MKRKENKTMQKGNKLILNTAFILTPFNEIKTGARVRFSGYKGAKRYEISYKVNDAETLNTLLTALYGYTFNIWRDANNNFKFCNIH